MHDLKAERLAFRLGKLFAREGVYAFPKTCVAERQGRVAAVKVLVNDLALVKSRKCAILPENRRGIRRSAEKSVMTGTERSVAELHSLIENLTEFIHVTACREADVNEIYGYNTLVESAVILGLAIFVNVGCQEGATAHTGVAMTLAVLVNLAFQHDFLGDIVGYHALCGAFCRQLGEIVIFRLGIDVILLENVDKLGEGGGDPHTLFILDALDSLVKNLLNNHGKVGLFGLVLRLAEIHKHGDEGRLSVCCQQGYNLILNALYASVDLFLKSDCGDFLNNLCRGLDACLGKLGCDSLSNLLSAHVNEWSEVG